MSTFAEPTVAWSSPDDSTRPLVVLLHGRRADEAGIIGLADHLPRRTVVRGGPRTDQ